MPLTIRPAQEADAAAMLELLLPLIEARKYTTMERGTLEEQLEFIRTFPARGVFHVALMDEKIVGMQDVMPLEPSPVFAHVGVISTFVKLRAHGGGIGRTLSEETFREAAAKGFGKLMATIRADNPNAVAFYLRRGFRMIGTAQKHARVGEKYVDEVLAERFLP